jgi:tRNA G10  N-methylase Trm11
VRLLAEDALSLPSIGDGEIDAIVTDPPWGEFTDTGMTYQAFVSRMAENFDRVLHPRKGRFSILVARRQAGTMSASIKAHGFSIREAQGILVNGHPATVIVGGR